MAVVGFLLLAGAVVGVAELLGRVYEPFARNAVYAGGGVGLAVVFIGLILTFKLSRLISRNGNSFWRWWGGGALLRLFLLLSMGLFFLSQWDPTREGRVAVLAMSAVYIFGMLAEAAFLGYAAVMANKQS